MKTKESSEKRVPELDSSSGTEPFQLFQLEGHPTIAESKVLKQNPKDVATV
jgi:hypothetical protein